MTPELLRAATGCSAENADRYAPHLALGCMLYQINSPRRLAAFLAQIGHESASLSVVEESLNYTPEALMRVFGERRIALAEAQALGRIDGRKADQRLIANLVYGREWGRKNLGNLEAEDGWRFRGQGLIQSTGRFNARRLTQRLRDRFPEAPDFEAQPERLKEPKWAALSACDYWDRTGCNALADADDFEGVTRRINGGMTGIDDRRRRWEVAKQALAEHVDAANTTPERVEAAPQTEHVATEWELNNPPPPPPEKPMAAPLVFLKAALPFLVEALPRLGRLFGSGSEVSERNLKAVEMAAETIKSAVGASTEQEAIEKLRTDPQARAAADRAIADRWYELVEAGGGGIDGARKASAEYLKPGAAGFWLNPSFWISLILVAMPMMLLVDVFYVHPETYVGELRTQIVTGVLMVIGMVGGYWIGTSISSARKDEKASQ